AKLIDAEAALPADGSPASVFVNGDAILACEPHGAAKERSYAAGGMLALVPPAKKSALVAGFLTAHVARPRIAATYHAGGKTTLTVTQQLLGRQLPPKKAIYLDFLYFRTG